MHPEQRGDALLRIEALESANEFIQYNEKTKNGFTNS